MKFIDLGNFLCKIFLINIFFFNPFLLASLETENKKNLKPKINTNYLNLDANYLKSFPKDEYILGTGDLIEIVVNLDIPEFTGSHKIDDNGTIFLPRLGRTYVSGLTLSELIELLTIFLTALLAFLTNLPKK